MIRIDSLKCVVTVATKKKAAPGGKTAATAKPSLAFAQAPPPAPSQAGPTPGASATAGKDAGGGGVGAGGAAAPASPLTADPRRVADRVYELIVDEIRQDRRRGQL